MVSIPFLVATFPVYAITPCLVIAYVFLVNYIYVSPIRVLCFTTGFIIYFPALASFFWLNVMCFDIWWTFGGFRSLQGSVKQRERKKFVMYSIYAWGSASILTVICVIMDFVPSVPKELIRPEFGKTKCWFNTNEAMAIYFIGPIGVTVICNICLFISTARKIVRHKKDTAAHLRSSESRRHDDNKQWFNLYLKLFIVMGLSWSMEIILWLFEGVPSLPSYVWYVVRLSDLRNTLQGLIIFIIFVWKKKIKRLLLKRFGCQDRSSPKTQRLAAVTAQPRAPVTSGIMSLQKVNPYVQTNCRMKSSSEAFSPKLDDYDFSKISIFSEHRLLQMFSFIAKPFVLVILNYRRYRNKRIRTQVQSPSEGVQRDGHKLVHGNNIMAIRGELAVVRLLMLKRFGCQDRGLFSRNSTRSGCYSSASRTCTTTSGMMSLQEKVNPYVQTNCRTKSSSDEAD